MRIIISDKTSAKCPEILRNAGLTVDEKYGISADELGTIINNYDGIIVRSATRITAKLLEKTTRLKVIGRAGTGVDNIDVAAAKAKNIIVMNTPGANTNAVAELALALMLMLARRLHEAVNTTKAGGWEKKNLVGYELSGKSVAILGYNRVGRLLTRKCRLLGMETVCFDPKINKNITDSERLEIKASLDATVENADFLSVHLTKSPATENFLNWDVFRKFRKGAVLVNCSRGGVVNESDLIRALNEDILSAAATDVYSQEPPTNTEFLNHPRLICTPHIGASTVEAQENVGILIAEQFVDFFSGKGARNTV